MIVYATQPSLDVIFFALPRHENGRCSSVISACTRGQELRRRGQTHNKPMKTTCSVFHIV